jgi:predicted transcriptional regulator
MKTATFPSLRVEPRLRQDAESVLAPGETLSKLMEVAIEELIDRRRTQAEFVARGLRSAELARAHNTDHPAEAVHAELRQRLQARRAQVLGA